MEDKGVFGAEVAGEVKTPSDLRQSMVTRDRMVYV